MRGQRRHNIVFLLLDLYSFFLLPTYTLLFSDCVTWFSGNFSVRAVSGLDCYRGLLVLGVLLSVYYGLLLGSLALKLPGPDLRGAEFLLLGMALASLLLGLPVPYLPETYPHLAQLHSILTFSASFWLMAALLFLLLAFRREDKKCDLLFGGWCVIASVSAVLFFLLGKISGALEIFFVLSTVWLTRRLWLQRFRL